MICLLEPQYHFGDKLLKFQVVWPHNGTAVLKGLISILVRVFVLVPGTAAVEIQTAVYNNQYTRHDSCLESLVTGMDATSIDYHILPY